jgi:hypothetical protein
MCGCDGRSFCACDAVVTLLGLCGFDVGVVALALDDCWFPMAYSGDCDCDGAPAVSWTCDDVHLSTQVRMRRDTGIGICIAAASPILPRTSQSRLSWGSQPSQCLQHHLIASVCRGHHHERDIAATLAHLPQWPTYAPSSSCRST